MKDSSLKNAGSKKDRSGRTNSSALSTWGRLIVFLPALAVSFFCSRDPEPLRHIRLPSANQASPPEAKRGYLVYDPKRRVYIRARNADTPFIPASAGKIPTALVALNVLGPEFRFQTRLVRVGRIENGVLQGSLYLKGEGDPRLRVADLLRFLDALEKAGIRRVRGRFIVDESILTARTSINGTMGTDAAYNPGLSALSLQYNVMKIRWKEKEKPGRRKKKKNPWRRKTRSVRDYRFYLTPRLPIHRLALTRRNLSREEEVLLQEKDDRVDWLYNKDFLKKAGARTQKLLPVRRPALYTGHVLRLLASHRGIRLPVPEKGRTPGNGELLARIESPPLVDLISLMLRWSSNASADMLLLRSARELRPEKLSLAESAKLVSAYLKKRLPGVDWKGFRLVNGSGLTSESRITPRQMVALLVWALDRDYSGRSFLSFLPIAGWSGSLNGRLDEPETAFRIFAKTGTLYYALALTGYYYDARGRRLIFARFHNDIPARAVADDSAHPRRKLVRARAPGWIRDNKKEIDEDLEEWLREGDVPGKKAAR